MMKGGHNMYTPFKWKLKAILIIFFYIVITGQIVVKRNIHDFGIVDADKYVYHTFEIENASDGDLFVQNIQAG